MKQFQIFTCILLVGLTGTLSSTIKYDLDYLDGVFALVYGMETSLDADINLFDSWNTQIANLIPEFDLHDQERANLFNCIRDRFHELQGSLAYCHTSSTNREQELLNDLTTLQTNTDLEITNLNTIKSTLESQLSECDAHRQQDRSDFASTITLLHNKYQAMTASRTMFLSSINTLIARIQAFHQFAELEGGAIAQEICDENPMDPYC